MAERARPLSQPFSLLTWVITETLPASRFIIVTKAYNIIIITVKNNQSLIALLNRLSSEVHASCVMRLTWLVIAKKGNKRFRFCKAKLKSAWKIKIMFSNGPAKVNE